MADLYHCSVCRKSSKGVFHVITKEILAFYHLDPRLYEKWICHTDYQRFCAHRICSKRLDTGDSSPPPVLNISQRIAFLQQSPEPLSGTTSRSTSSSTSRGRDQENRRRDFSTNWWSNPSTRRGLGGIQSYRSEMYVPEDQVKPDDGASSASGNGEGDGGGVADVTSDSDEEESREEGGFGIQVQGLSLAEKRILEADKCGFLTKEGAIVKNWKRRFFVLKDLVLSYYEHPNAAKPLGKILLPSYSCDKGQTDVPGRQYYFSISHPGMRTYNFYADNDSERQAWMEAIVQMGLATGSSADFKAHVAVSATGEDLTELEVHFSNCDKFGSIVYSRVDGSGKCTGYLALEKLMLTVYTTGDIGTPHVRIPLHGVNLEPHVSNTRKFSISDAASFECASTQERNEWMNTINEVIGSSTLIEVPARSREASDSGFMFAEDATEFLREFVEEMKNYLAVLDFCIKHLTGRYSREDKERKRILSHRRAQSSSNLVPDRHGRMSLQRTDSLIFQSKSIFEEEKGNDAEDSGNAEIRELLEEVFQGYEELYDVDCAFFAELWGTGTIGDDPSRNIANYVEGCTKRGIFDRLMGNFLTAMLLIDENAGREDLHSFLASLQFPHALLNPIEGQAQSKETASVTLFDLYVFVARPVLEIAVRARLIDKRLASPSTSQDERSSLGAASRALSNLRLGFFNFFDAAEAAYDVALRAHSLQFMGNASLSLLCPNFGFSVRFVHEGELMLIAKGYGKDRSSKLGMNSFGPDKPHYWILFSHALVCAEQITQAASFRESAESVDPTIPFSLRSISANIKKTLRVSFVVPLDSIVIHDIPEHASVSQKNEFQLIPDDAAGEVLLVAALSAEEKQDWIAALLSIPSLAQRSQSEVTARSMFQRRFSKRYSTNVDEMAIIPAMKSDDAKARSEVVKEIFISEKAYVTDLKVLIDVFYYPMKELRGVSEELHSKIFSNLLELYKCNVKLLEVLEVVHSEFGDDVDKVMKGMADAFFEATKKMRGYTRYCSRQESSGLAVTELCKRDAEVKKFLENARIEDPRVEKKGILDFLIKPMQRITKYPLLFKELLKNMPGDHPAREHSVEALKALSMLALSINEYLREVEDLQRVNLIESLIDGMPQELILAKKGRYLVKEGLHKKWSQSSGRIQERFMWLFNDLLLYGRQKSSGRFAYKGHIFLSGCAVTTLPESALATSASSSSTVSSQTPQGGKKLRTQYKFQIIPPSVNKKYTLFFITEIEMKEWLCSIIQNIREIDLASSEYGSNIGDMSSKAESNGSEE